MIRISAFYSQIELRLLAEVADVPTLRQAFKDGIDIHAITASEMFGVPVKDMPGEVRRRAKAINFGIIYGISAFGLAFLLGFVRGEAGAAINARLQGSAADIIRRAMMRMEGERASAKLKAQMLLQVHDELIFEVPDKEVADTIPIIRDVMEGAPHPAIAMNVPLQVEARAADNWDEAHKR